MCFFDGAGNGGVFSQQGRLCSSCAIFSGVTGEYVGCKLDTIYGGSEQQIRDAWNNGSVTKTVTTVSGASYYGPFFQIACSKPFVASNALIHSSTLRYRGYGMMQPTTIVVLGAVTGQNWNYISALDLTKMPSSVEGAAVVTPEYKFPFSNNQAYNFYRFIVTNIDPAGTAPEGLSIMVMGGFRLT